MKYLFGKTRSRDLMQLFMDANMRKKRELKGKERERERERRNNT